MSLYKVSDFNQESPCSKIYEQENQGNYGITMWTLWCNYVDEDLQKIVNDITTRIGDGGVEVVTKKNYERKTNAVVVGREKTDPLLQFIPDSEGDLSDGDTASVDLSEIIFRKSYKNVEPENLTTGVKEIPTVKFDDISLQPHTLKWHSLSPIIPIKSKKSVHHKRCFKKKSAEIPPLGFLKLVQTITKQVVPEYSNGLKFKRSALKALLISTDSILRGTVEDLINA